jgi:hypothetical protein
MKNPAKVAAVEKYISFYFFFSKKPGSTVENVKREGSCKEAEMRYRPKKAACPSARPTRGHLSFFALDIYSTGEWGGPKLSFSKGG